MLLMADDDRELVDLLAFVLDRAGFDTEAAYNPTMLLQVFEKHPPDLVLLNPDLGHSGDFELLKELRRRTKNPVILLSGRHNEDDVVSGLNLGADDYVTKPFSHRELVARIRAILRRRSREGRSADAVRTKLQADGLVLNPATHEVTVEGAPVTLTPTEFRLLQYLMMNQGLAIPALAVLRHVWGYEDPAGAELVRVTVHRVRRKLGEPCHDPRYLHTVPGVGFMLKPPGYAAASGGMESSRSGPNLAA
jgi:DNA-binding response OmpR family regulator